MNNLIASLFALTVSNLAAANGGTLSGFAGYDENPNQYEFKAFAESARASIKTKFRPSSHEEVMEDLYVVRGGQKWLGFFMGRFPIEATERMNSKGSHLQDSLFLSSYSLRR